MRDMQCPSCKRGECEKCPNVLLEAVGRSPVCTCTRKGHNGTEPNEVQITDPFTGAVHAPGLVVTESGAVQRTRVPGAPPSVVDPALRPCRSEHLDCTPDCGWCKGTGIDGGIVEPIKCPYHRVELKLVVSEDELTSFLACPVCAPEVTGD